MIRNSLYGLNRTEHREWSTAEVTSPAIKGGKAARLVAAVAVARKVQVALVAVDQEEPVASKAAVQANGSSIALKVPIE